MSSDLRGSTGAVDNRASLMSATACVLETDTDTSRPGGSPTSTPGLADQKDTDRLMDMMTPSGDPRQDRRAWRTCVECGVALVPQNHWRQMSRPERRAMETEGFRQHFARNLCAADYQRRRYQGSLVDVERCTLSRDELLDEWQHFTKARATHTANIRAFAAYLDRPYPSIERALTRAGVTATRDHPESKVA